MFIWNIYFNFYRIDWLQQGSRELFGTIIEDQVYILIDVSNSMQNHLGLVKEKLYRLMQVREKTGLAFIFVGLVKHFFDGDGT